MRDRIFIKCLVVGIIVLLIGVGVYPAFAINIKKSYDSSNIISGKENLNNAIVKTFVRIHKPDGIKSYTLTITEEQKDELDAFFDSFKQELDKAETYEEIITIYNDVIVTLDNIGFIPKDIGVKQLQNLITRNAQLINRNRINKNTYAEEYENLFCLVTGQSRNTYRVSDVIFPGNFFRIAHGCWDNLAGVHRPADGWIYTQGMYGKWSYDGKFYGTLDIEYGPFFNEYYVGAKGFMGVVLRPYFYYIGFAVRVGIKKV